MADNLEETPLHNPHDPDRVGRTPGTQAGAVKTASGINVIAGIWLIISPFVLTFYRDPAATWDLIIVGIIVLILAATRVAGPLRTAWASWINLILGIWLIISPFVLRYAHNYTAMWDSIILGIIVGVCAIWSGAATPARARGTYTEPGTL